MAFSYKGATSATLGALGAILVTAIAFGATKTPFEAVVVSGLVAIYIGISGISSIVGRMFVLLSALCYRPLDEHERHEVETALRSVASQATSIGAREIVVILRNSIMSLMAIWQVLIAR